MFAMTSIQGESEILRTDKRGRVRTTLERRQKLLAEFDRSGLSGSKFAALTGLKYQTLAGWLQRRRKQRNDVSPVATGSNAPAVQWLETVIQSTQPPTASGLVVRLPSGATLEVTTANQASLAAAVLRAWEKPLC
jgi:hypothetical protein